MSGDDLYGTGCDADPPRWRVIRIPAGQRGTLAPTADGFAVAEFHTPVTAEDFRRLLAEDE